VELKKYCVTLLEKFGSLSYTTHTLEELDAEARADIANLEAIHCQKISWMNSWNGSGTQSDKNPEQ
jgi:hypothetical protein